MGGEPNWRKAKVLEALEGAVMATILGEKGEAARFRVVASVYAVGAGLEAAEIRALQSQAEMNIVEECDFKF